MSKQRGSRLPSKRRKRRNAPYLGKVDLYWCDACNIPLFNKTPCDICKQAGRKVPISPPGDIRPAFEGDYQILIATFNRQYGQNLGYLFFGVSIEDPVPNQTTETSFPQGTGVVLLNRTGGIDRTEEVILDGYIVGRLVYDPLKSHFRFDLRTAGGQWLADFTNTLELPLTKFIRLKDDTHQFTLKGKSLLVPGIEAIGSLGEKDEKVPALYRPLVPPGEYTAVNRELCVAIGILKDDYAGLSALMAAGKGQIAKNKHNIKQLGDAFPAPQQLHQRIQYFNENRGHPQLPTHTQILHHLQQAAIGNRTGLTRIRAKALKFIRKTATEQNKPLAVAYSGGKDSLATLMLVYEALGPLFKIFFADTGLELPEVLENIQDVAHYFGMHDKLLIRSAGDHFWSLVDSFGPPGRDFRYCCHSLKAQQIMDLIESLYGGEKVLVYLGQRRYESLNRSQNPLVYVNSFIPLQIAATPIRDWNALQLWLYVLFTDPLTNRTEDVEQAHPTGSPGTTFNAQLPITPLYFKGQERLGCYLCPASSMASLSLLRETHPTLHGRWTDTLEKYRVDRGYPDEWISLGLWRYKQLPLQWKNLLKEQGMEGLLTSVPVDAANVSADSVEIKITKGISPCIQSGYSMKGRVNLLFDMEILRNWAPTLTPKCEYDDDLNILSLKGVMKGEAYRVNLFPDGTFFLQSKSAEFNYWGLLQLVVGTILRAHFCNLCGTCRVVCPVKAISDIGGRMVVDVGICTSCRKCITHCPLYADAKQIVEKARAQSAE